MTEMEYEKAARGTSGGTNTRTYPWGNTTPTTASYYANWTTSVNGRPIDVGWYLSQGYALSPINNREYTGASPYGIADLAGNLWANLINCDWTTVPANGNGTITAPASWPLAAALGKGSRGGYWNSSAADLRVSDRRNGGYTYTTRNVSVGFRPARTK